MFRAFAVSLKSSDFYQFQCSQGEVCSKCPVWMVRPEVATRLGNYTSDFAIIYDDTMNGFATPEESHETELDGTYDRFLNIIVHWRNDGFIDFVAFDSIPAAQREMQDITSVFA
jgi:hypothetical protein